MSLRRLQFLLCVLFLIAAKPLAAQTDVIRGKVINQDSVPIEGVRVTVTSISGAVNRQARTDKGGRFTVTFPNGEGDYFVTFNQIGYAQKRFEVKRTADQDILIADAKLSRSQELDAMRITGSRDRVDRNDANKDISGTEKAVNTSALAADQLGNLAAMAASLPGVTLIPGADGDPSGFSVLGLSADQSSTTLNGAAFGGGDLPRDAALSSSLNSSQWDVSSGGSSGGRFSVRTSGGSNFKIRSASLNLDSPALQWTDRAARALGQEYSNASLSGRFSGPVKLDESFYTFSYQLGRRSNELKTLLNTDALGLQTSGISADSVTRLTNILNQLKVPTTLGGIPSNRMSDQGLVLGTIDVAPTGSRSGTAWNLTYQGSWGKNTPVLNATGEFPAHSGDRTNWNGMVQGRHSTYFGFGVLSETQLSYSSAKNWGTPYLSLPSGSVLVNSAFADGTNGVKFVQFGGSAFLNASSRNGTAQFSNLLSWFSENNKHRIKLTTELRRDDYTQDQTTNLLGSFSFNSLADVQAGRPAVFSRNLSPRQREGAQYIGGIALGDSYRRTSDLQIQYGLRVDGNQYEGIPVRNTKLEETFGVRNDYVPNKVYLSPRVGFSWTYGTAQQIGGFEGAMRGPRAVVRGGIGVFQNTPQTQLVGNAIDNTGLPSAVQQVTCMGPAAPLPNWDAYSTSLANIPSACVDGSAGTVFANSAPNVTLFSKDYAAQRALRSVLSWSGSILNNTFQATFQGTYSRNMNQTGAGVDLNFSPVQRFALASEAGRPVYVQPTSIVPTSGAIASRDARVTSLYNRVSEMRSDLTSESQQLQASFSPVTFNTSWSWNLAYVYSNFREQYRGFSSTAGNPLDVTWGRSSMDAHHQVTYTVGYNFFDAVRVSWNGRVQSGSPFTPTIAGDVNGDGYSNDRAFIYNPATAPDPTVASAMQSLLAKSSANVRNCLQGQLGRIADRNSCEGPWTTTANMSISFNPLKLGLPQRATLSLAINNPLGAADLVLHGENNLKGWGQPATPDNQLLYVRGYDPTAQRFKYEVNQRFGNTSPATNAFRQPVVVTAMMRFDLGPAREKQQLVSQLNVGRRSAGNKMSEQILKMVYANAGGLVNPMATMLRQADSLGLTQKQADSLATLNRWYTVRLDSIWSPAAKLLAALPDKYDEDEAYRVYRRAREGTVDVLTKLAPGTKALLTPEQRRKLPAIVASYLEPRYLAAIRSGTAGAGGSAFGPGGGMVMPVGGGGGQQVIIMR